MFIHFINVVFEITKNYSFYQIFSNIIFTITINKITIIVICKYLIYNKNECRTFIDIISNLSNQIIINVNINIVDSLFD